MKRKYLPIFFLIFSSCVPSEDEDPDIKIKFLNAYHESIICNWRLNYPKFYPYIECPSQTEKDLYKLDIHSNYKSNYIDKGELVYITIFDKKNIDGFDPGRKAFDAVSAVYCVDFKWLSANQFFITYPYQGDTTITYYESINGNEIIRHDGYFGTHYEFIKNHPDIFF